MEFHYPQHPVFGNSLYTDPDDRILEGKPGFSEKRKASVHHYVDVCVYRDDLLASVL